MHHRQSTPHGPRHQSCRPLNSKPSFGIESSTNICIQERNLSQSGTETQRCQIGVSIPLLKHGDDRCRKRLPRVFLFTTHRKTSLVLLRTKVVKERNPFYHFWPSISLPDATLWEEKQHNIYKQLVSQIGLCRRDSIT